MIPAVEARLQRRPLSQSVLFKRVISLFNLVSRAMGRRSRAWLRSVANR